MLERFCWRLQIFLGSPFPLAKEEELPAVLLAKRSLEAQKPPSAEPPSLAGCWLTNSSQSEVALQRDFVQTDVLHGRPDNGQATGLRGEDVDLIGALAHIAEKTFNGIGALNMAVHRLRKGVKREKVLFILRQASHCFGIAYGVLGFEGSQLG